MRASRDAFIIRFATRVGRLLEIGTDSVEKYLKFTDAVIKL